MLYFCLYSVVIWDLQIWEQCTPVAGFETYGNGEVTRSRNKTDSYWSHKVFVEIMVKLQDMYICMCMCMSLGMYMMYICVCICIWCVYMYVYVYDVYVCICICIYIYIYTIHNIYIKIWSSVSFILNWTWICYAVECHIGLLILQVSLPCAGISDVCHHAWISCILNL